jgi:hypothetical protein
MVFQYLYFSRQTAGLHCANPPYGPALAMTITNARSPLQRHDDLAEMLVGFHVLERLANIVEGEHTIDRQLQLPRVHGAPDVLSDRISSMVRVRKVTPIYWMRRADRLSQVASEACRAPCRVRCRI